MPESDASGWPPSTTAACDLLQALINESSAQSGKQLTRDQAKAITDAALGIRTTLGCS